MDGPQDLTPGERRRGHGPRWLAAGALLVAGGAAYHLLRETDAPASSTIEGFLAEHWQRPLPPQGAVPAHFSAVEASLDPAACGQCHAPQFEQWSGSLHSRTMTAGVLWQLRHMQQAEANRCLDCHAPLAEQKALVAMEHGWPGVPRDPPPDHVPQTLGHQGLVCAACHVRQHQRFGPGRAAPAAPDAAGRQPHDGFIAEAAFGDSRFCASCHQFPDDGPRTNGKLREDTYGQWLASPQAARGETCQSCHMPGRAHAWEGIHSPQMVRRALTPTLSIAQGVATATLVNTGAGHHFPTYMVPKITAQLVLAGQREVVLDETVIGWEVDVSLDHEAFDTRLAPGEGITLSAPLPAGAGAGSQVELRVQVAPREHYERSFASVLAQRDRLDATTLQLLQQAHDEAHGTRFEALRMTLPLASGTPAR